MTIVEYLDSAKERLLSDQMVFSLRVARERAAPADSHLRARLTLSDDQINVVTYSYPWSRLRLS